MTPQPPQDPAVSAAAGVGARDDAQPASPPLVPADMFSAAAKDAYSRLADEHLRDLATISLIQMRRAGADVVSAAHVEAGAALLGHSPRTKKVKVVNTASGIVAGVGGGQFTAMVSAGEYSTAGVVCSFLFAVAGVVGLAYSNA